MGKRSGGDSIIGIDSPALVPSQSPSTKSPQVKASSMLSQRPKRLGAGSGAKLGLGKATLKRMTK